MRNIFFCCCFLALAVSATGQDSAGLSFSGYAEAYYQFDFNKPPDNNRPVFFYSHNRHNEFTINLAYLKANYSATRVRANLAFGAGTYMNANYAAEPGVLKNIVEANAGVKISRHKNWWVDAGILPSHIGFESAVSKDCWTVTRSMLADNSPYFEAGAKITYITDDGKWLISGMALNGWQRITRLSGNTMMSWGTQLQYKPSQKVLINYSTFLGTDKPDSTRQLRFFHNLYGIFSVTDKLGLITGFDIGREERLTGGSNTWLSPVSIIKYSFNNKWAVAARAEYYSDKKNIIISTGFPNGFQTSGYSLNIDHSPFSNVLLRVEIRNLHGRNAVFNRHNATVNNNTSVAASLSASF